MNKISALLVATTMTFALSSAPALAGPGKKDGKTHSQSMKVKGQKMKEDKSGMKDKDLTNDRANENRDAAYDRYEDNRDAFEDARDERMEDRDERWEDRIEDREDRLEDREERMDDRFEDRMDHQMRGRGNANVSDGRLSDRALPAQAIQNSRRAATVNCPFGTTAQPNGTCLVTGDYKF